MKGVPLYKTTCKNTSVHLDITERQLIIAIFNSRVSDKQAAYKNRDSYGRFLADSKQSIFLKFVFKYIAVFKKYIFYFHFALV